MRRVEYTDKKLVFKECLSKSIDPFNEFIRDISQIDVFKEVTKCTLHWVSQKEDLAQPMIDWYVQILLKKIPSTEPRNTKMLQSLLDLLIDDNSKLLSPCFTRVFLHLVDHFSKADLLAGGTRPRNCTILFTEPLFLKIMQVKNKSDSENPEMRNNSFLL